jgi:hypothetical protein
MKTAGKDYDEHLLQFIADTNVKFFSIILDKRFNHITSLQIISGEKVPLRVVTFTAGKING